MTTLGGERQEKWAHLGDEVGAVVFSGVVGRDEGVGIHESGLDCGTTRRAGQGHSVVIGRQLPPGRRIQLVNVKA